MDLAPALRDVDPRDANLAQADILASGTGLFSLCDVQGLPEGALDEDLGAIGHEALERFPAPAGSDGSLLVVVPVAKPGVAIAIGSDNASDIVMKRK